MGQRHPTLAVRFVSSSLLALALGCGGVTVGGHIPARTPLTSGTGSLQAGAARVDLTPIPGIPLGGYSIAGKISRGFWTRLWARAIYLEDAAGEPLVLLSSNLMIMPNGLADRIAQLVQADPALKHIGRENLLIAATETHQSPGNFFTSRLYNAYSSPRTGFDNELFDFLATRLSWVVKQAYLAREDAKLLANDPAVDARLSLFFRNRSFGAFQLNPEADKYVSDNAALALCPDPDDAFPDPRACRAVHADVEFLHFVKTSGAGAGDTIGVAVFVATHSTVLNADTELYSGDLFEATTTRLERGLAGGACAAPGFPALPVVAIFNGAQGDVTTLWSQRNRVELIGMADKLADKVCSGIASAVQQGSAASPPGIAFQYQVVEPLAGRSFADGSDRASGYPRHTSSDALAGAPELGGAEDGRTLLYEMGLQEGLRDFARHDHGIKLPPGRIEALGTTINLSRLPMEMDPPPKRAPIGVYRIGNVALAALPGEFTTMMGERVRKQVTAKIADPLLERVILVGFGNGHVSYFTTPEEYDAQSYEGASNYYGAAAAPLLNHELGVLAAQLPNASSPPAPRDYAYEVGQERRFEVRDAWAPPYWVDDGLSNIVSNSDGSPVRSYPTFCWIDSIPRLGPGGPACGRTVPDVSIRKFGTTFTRVVNGAAQDNHGLDLVTVMAGVSSTQMEWCAIWMIPDAEDQALSFQFFVEKVGGGVRESIGFTPASGPFLHRPAASPLPPDEPGGLLCMLGLCPDPTTCSVPPPS
ncbi:MAG: neutral/alkaline non-lysosomal ceramidase N-terminal domain-containing protein [Proteobacteria bacterium]|nr:neutral/alkaline non-lysosomal ceramidase N-terminal domain-containing protein [Pseudomonadota bacterium]